MTAAEPGPTQPVPVLVAAAGEPWESEALNLVAAARPRLVLHKRCLDLADLLATGQTGVAAVALLSSDLAGVDADSVDLLRRSGVATVLVAEGEAARWSRLGIQHVIGPEHLPQLPGVLLTAAAVVTAPPEPERQTAIDREVPDRPSARVLAVWGPAGAPGRTTVVVNLARELAALGCQPFLIDADPYAGSVAQHLGVLDEVSGLLAACRRANAGELDPAVLADLARSADGIRVLTGLPRADRWNEVRPAAFEAVLTAGTALASHLLLDVGFSLERDPEEEFGGRPGRNSMTLAALARADEVVVVGAADPVGLTRLARGLVELRSASTAPLRVVVNRTRSTLGWSQRDLRAMVEGFVAPLGIHFLPEDRTACDRALMAGRPLHEGGDCALRRDLAAIAAAVGGLPAARPRRRTRRRGRRVPAG
jgi:MinD-like ATPase involved in chromosome partitioning or flagellar assembly